MKLNRHNSKPLVSVCCVTYNHKDYIESAIEGFLIQKTSFPIEVIIHDDASTDGTTHIVKRYADKNPGLIFLILQNENQYSQGGKPLQNFIWPRALGKYIALCEGDDYWTDPLKLQKQVDFLETNPDCSICFHATERVYENQPEKNYIHRPLNIPANSRFGIEHVILGGGGFMATNSIMTLREHLLDRPSWVDKAPVGDGPLMLICATKGEVGYIDDVMGKYRVLTANSWSSTMHNPKKRREHYLAIIEMWNEFDKWTHGKYHKFVRQKKILNTYNHYRIKLNYIRLKLKPLLRKISSYYLLKS